MCVSGVGGGPGRSLFKRLAEVWRARPALAAQTCGLGSRVRCGWAVGAGSGAAPSALGPRSRRSRPSRAARLPVSGSHALIFSPPLPPLPPSGACTRAGCVRSLRSPEPRRTQRPAPPRPRSRARRRRRQWRQQQRHCGGRSPLQLPGSCRRTSRAAPGLRPKRPPAPPRRARDCRRLRARRGPQRQRRPPWPGLPAPRAARGWPPPPCASRAQPTPGRRVHLADAR